MKTYKNLDKPIIFIGSGRSGTTILSDIVLRHPDLAFPSNYLEFAPSLPVMNLIRLVFDNKMWRIFGRRTYNRSPLNPNNYTFRPTEGYRMWDHITGDEIDFSNDFLLKSSAENPEKIRRYFQKMVKLQGRKRLAFKITGPSRIGFLLSIFPDALFIDSRREIVPTVSSFLKQSFWQEFGAQEVKWQGPYSESELNWFDKNKDRAELMTAYQIGMIHRMTDEEVNKYNPDYRIVNYEDLMKDPKSVIDNLFEFLDLDPSKACNDFLKQIRTENISKSDTDYFEEEKVKDIKEIYNKSASSLTV